jgi:hypothetical protein
MSVRNCFHFRFENICNPPLDEAIMLARIKLSFPDIRRALLAVDDEKLSVDDIKAISKQLPTAEEAARIRDFGDVGKLAKADQYFGEVRELVSRASLDRALIARHPRSSSSHGCKNDWTACCIAEG